MRLLILTDMHGNWDALQAVLRHVRRKRFDGTLVLGDLVGYGAAPNQIVEALEGLPKPVHEVRGNHDKVVAGIEDGDAFNDAALSAALWTRERLTPRNLGRVRRLPKGPRKVYEELAICHGTPLDEDDYLFAEAEADRIFQGFDPSVRLIFFGHTHLPSVFIAHPGGVRGVLLSGERGRIRVQPGFRYLVNPGSVGQPRDRDPRAAFMIYDSDAEIVHWYRLDYDVSRAQKRILEAGLPSSLAERLTYGV